jgi:2-polyprenyl-3-methyl-5-hydroxy-6-metoxy-1,4-benzoquinol methylase
MSKSPTQPTAPEASMLNTAPFPLDPAWPASWRISYRYDQLEVWNQDNKRGYAYTVRHDRTLQLACAVKTPPARVLDVAAAQGNFSLALAALGYDVTWNDLRADLVGYVKLKQRGLPLTFLPGNVFSLQPEVIGRFDLIVATEIIEHVAHVDWFLAKLRTLLKPDGAIVLTTPNGRYFLNGLPKFSDCADPSIYETVQYRPNSDGHIFLLHPDELRTLANDVQLSVTHLTTQITSLTAGHIKLRYLLRVLPARLVERWERSSWSLPSPVRQRVHTNIAAVLVPRAA